MTNSCSSNSLLLLGLFLLSIILCVNCDGYFYISPFKQSYVVAKGWHSPIWNHTVDSMSVVNDPSLQTIIHSRHISAITEHCSHNSRADTGNGFTSIMNGCWLSYHPENKIAFMARDFSLWVLSWLNGWFVCRVLFILLVGIAFWMGSYDRDEVTSELVTKRAWYLWEWGILLIRISTIMAFATWLLMPVRQASPCACWMSGTTEIKYSLQGQSDTHYYKSFDWNSPHASVIGYPFNFPSVNLMVSMTIALYLCERFNIFVGILLALFLPLLEIIGGMSSVGQCIPSIVLGVLLYVYGRFTPPIVRLVDIILNLLVGIFAISLPKQFSTYSIIPWDFARLYLEAQVWQLFVVVLFVSQLSLSFIKKMSMRRLYTFRSLDLLYLPMELIPNRLLKEGLNEGYRQNQTYGDEVEDNDTLNDYRISSGEGYMFTRLWDQKLCVVFLAVITFIILGLVNLSVFWIDDYLYVQGLVKRFH